MRLASNRGEVVEMIPKITQIDPDSVEQYWCGKCGSSLIWKIQNHPWSYFMASSDYVGGPICRTCMETHCVQTDCAQCETGR